MPAKRKASTKSASQAAPERDMLTDAARAIGSALGTLAAKAKALPPEVMALAKKVSSKRKTGKTRGKRRAKSK